MASRRRGLWLCLVVFMVAGHWAADAQTSPVPTTTTTGPDISHLCYACRETGDHGPCRDFKALQKAGLAFGVGPLVQNCSTDQKYCTIEEYEEHGTSTIIRGCSNLSISSFDLKTGRLLLVKPDNNSVCSYNIKEKGVQCVSMCLAPLCNGPDVLSAASSLPRSIRLLVTTFLVSTSWSLYAAM